MTVEVSIPTQLRGLTQDKSEVAVSGTTVAEVLNALDANYPGIAQRLLDEDGRLRRFVNVYLDEEDVRFLDGLSTPVTDASRLSIIPAVAGG
ncbi:MAG TPA: ubiquitin-like small modifier protein 1 [Actinomycetota bacterium]|nr:ubiquitin-like small modifier protein 1 [Actinomycetota bacterium]